LVIELPPSAGAFHVTQAAAFAAIAVTFVGAPGAVTTGVGVGAGVGDGAGVAVGDGVGLAVGAGVGVGDAAAKKSAMALAPPSFVVRAGRPNPASMVLSNE